ncbi:MAG: diguanylate cyclase [Chitinispirillales bacterium]|jgi:diguanylate cyclase (GGDEF)-like protein/PAS domain S-box-containing protein|nr:diguanylate cyclase [Chitinispirillales bacterium]
MRVSKKIPELEKVLHKWKITVSDAKSLSAVMFIALVGFNVLVVCAASLLPRAWHITLPLCLIALLWDLLWAASITKQIISDQTSISKNRVLFRRFQNTTKYFESILQDTSDIIISLDKDSLIFKFNTGAQNHFGYTQAEILGKPFEILFLDAADKEKMFLPDKSGVKPANAEIPMKTKAGRCLVLNMCISRMRDSGFVVTAQDITEKKYLEEQLKQKSEQLNRLAITDDLTGLFNSRHFYNAIKSELSRLKRHSDRKLSIIYMDVDKFKEYNDAEGHLMGDKVLKALGEVINSCVRKDIDAGFRYGGDEFVVILPDTDMIQAKTVATRILELFCALRFGNTSLSIGIAEAISEEDEKTLVRRADMAMYVSKKSVTERITFADIDVTDENVSKE